MCFEVAPYVGAWIETQVCRLELAYHNVAPYVGAWIETYTQACSCRNTESHPTWVRGLKLVGCVAFFSGRGSHPTWVRGLKRHKSVQRNAHRVAPYVGAWIETYRLLYYCYKAEVAPYVGAWIETCILSPMQLRNIGRTLRGCVD